MRKNPTNLFTWATSELSQDAFICWLIAWAKPENKMVDELMHETGTDFLRALLSKHEEKNPNIGDIEIKELEIRPQHEHIDILVLVNNKYALILEDKVHAGTHGNQLESYVKTIEKDKEYKNFIILPTFVKTGDQSRYYKEEQEGYKLFLRKDFLSVLSQAHDKKVDNDILGNFIESIERLDADVNSFLTTPANNEWSSNAWKGFYEHLQSKIPSVKWKYVPNASGGFWGAWWNVIKRENCEVYLLIEEGSLCFKISVNKMTYQAQLRNEWSTKILKTAPHVGLDNVVKPSRFGKGKSMTIAKIEIDNWVVKNVNNCIDLDSTLKKLEKAAECLNHAAIS